MKPPFLHLYSHFALARGASIGNSDKSHSHVRCHREGSSPHLALQLQLSFFCWMCAAVAVAARAQKLRLRGRSCGASISGRVALCEGGDAEQGRFSHPDFSVPAWMGHARVSRSGRIAREVSRRS